MPEQAGPQFDVDPAGGVRKHVSAQCGQQDFEQGDSDQADGDDVKGRQAAMDQDFVGNNLEEQRGDQAKALQDDGDEQDFEQELAVFDDGRYEPAEVKFSEFAGQRSPGGEEDQLAGAACLEVR